MATSMGGYTDASYLESAVAVALTLRGAEVDILLCDEALPACQITEFGQVSPGELAVAERQPRCEGCHSFGESVFGPLGLPTHWYGEYLSENERVLAHRMSGELCLRDIRDYRLEGLAVGEHALAGALRYFARGDLENEPAAEPILRRYLEAAIVTVLAVRNLLDRHHYDVVCFNHGIYVPQGLIGEVCRARGVRVVNWNPAYRKHSFVFSHDDSYHHTMIAEPTSTWTDVDWTPRLEQETLAYLKSRWHGTQDWIWFHDRPEEDADALLQALGVDPGRPIVALLTSVVWDAQLHYESNAFPSMMDWVKETVAYFATRPDLQLVIRVHPAEVRGAIPSRQRVADELASAFPSLPGNVFLIRPDDQASTYALVERCNAAVIYNTKTGIEISSMGVPVIVAGEAWVRNKGFTLDAESADAYRAILDRLPFAERLSAERLERARKYAFHFFFRRMIPLPFVGWRDPDSPPLRISDIADLGPERYVGLDVICDGILRGDPFVYPAERELQA